MKPGAKCQQTTLEAAPGRYFWGFACLRFHLLGWGMGISRLGRASVPCDYTRGGFQPIGHPKLKATSATSWRDANWTATLQLSTIRRLGRVATPAIEAPLRKTVTVQTGRFCCLDGLRKGDYRSDQRFWGATLAGIDFRTVWPPFYARAIRHPKRNGPSTGES